MSSSNDLAVIAVHFNPCGYRSRVRNYQHFRENLGNVPLLTLELCFGETEPELPYPEVTLLRGGDIMWQKSRLINIGIERMLAKGYTKIAWLDADIVFQDQLWYQRVSKALDQYSVVQCFSNCRRTFSDGYLDELSAVYAAAIDRPRTGGIGLAWAARADVLHQVSLYQYCIVGGDDLAWYLACMNLDNTIHKVVEDPVNKHFFGYSSPDFISHYLEWAGKCSTVINKSIGYVDQAVFAHPHGKLSDRYYSNRHGVLHYFDPHKDVTHEPGGPLYWTSNKPKLHQIVADYFYHRNEDAGSPSFSTSR